MQQVAEVQEEPALHDVNPVGRRLREARVRIGLSQADIASRLGTTRQYVHRLEVGPAPSHAALQRYLVALACVLASQAGMDPDRIEQLLGQPYEAPGWRVIRASE
jgi:transcriptional regulator with XRE-family HTH domain